MMRSLERLLRPKSIALFGGNWTANVIEQLKKAGFSGDIWPVNPKRPDIRGLPCFASIDDLPSPPDASFIGINREATVGLVRRLREIGAGGATCFASGFRESETESPGGAGLQAQLLEAAGDMPVLGPNCYGFINYLDNVAMWPDQHGGRPVKSGVAIIAQSSNIAINMTMQARGLPIAYVVTVGNQAQTGIAEIATAMLEDSRVTAIGLYLESFGDIRALEAFAATARNAGVPVVALKIGRSEKAKAGMMTHTASLAGSDTAASTLIRRLGFAEVRSIGVFLETLKLLDTIGPISGNAICSVSCSGGEATLMADMAEGSRIDWRDFSPGQRAALKSELGPAVTISNPLDYHTYIWGDTPRMTRVFAKIMRDGFDLVIFVLDIPRIDRCDPRGHQCAIDAIIAATRETGARVAVLTSLPENMTEALADTFRAKGIVPLHGMEEGLLAIEGAIANPSRSPRPALISDAAPANTVTLTEAQSKADLAAFGLPLPRSAVAESVADIAAATENLRFPVVLKGLGITHKSEAGALALDLPHIAAVQAAACRMKHVANGFLIEEMASGGVAELLAGVTRDPTGVMMLTIGTGGVMAELIADTVTLLLPADREDILEALLPLKAMRLIEGWRGSPAGDVHAVVNAIVAICRYGEANAHCLVELDVNPLIVRNADAIAVDALIRLNREDKR
jgi:acyl-CoA synthetase (NDP forming)